MQEEKIFSAYDRVGKFSDLYDGMMANKSFLGRFAMKFFWGLSDEDYQKFLSYAFAGIPQNFSGKLLEVPIGTGVLSLPIYKNFPAAKIFGLDYSEKMLQVAATHAQELNLRNVELVQGDVGNLNFPDNNFEIVLSINGLHAFQKKVSAYEEIFRVLKEDGIFCGTVYVRGENFLTDKFVKNFCERFGYFVAPYETAESLQKKLREIYREVKISVVGSFAGFICRKNFKV